MKTTQPWRAALTLAAALMMVATPALPAIAASPIQAPGEVVIFSTTDGATVEIDGRPVGKLPMNDSLVVDAGMHKIRVSLRGWTEYIDTFEVKPGEEVELEIDLIPFAGIVKVTTQEPGASVKVDGKVEGVTPFDKDIAVGKKVVTISRPGFYDESRELEIKPGKEYVLDVELRPEPKVAGDGSFYEQWWFWTIIGVAGAGAATAIALSSGGETAPPSAAFTLQVP